MKIGIFGGSFNPIHYGHLRIARLAKEYFDLDKVLFIPAGNPYMKNGDEMAPFYDRAEMIEIAIKGYDWAEVSYIECSDKPSYTADTLKSLIASDEKEDGFNDYYVIVGEDAYNAMDTWKDYQYILDNTFIIAFSRTGKIKEKYGYTSTFLPMQVEPDGISSTRVRHLIAEGKSCGAWVPLSVLNYIKQKGLYKKMGFDANKAKEDVVEWIRNKMNKFGEDTKAIIGISGGKDSSVVAALCVEALGKDRVYGVTMPDGEQADLDDSLRVIEHLGIHHVPLNIHAITNACRMECIFGMGVELSKDALINMPARIRMTMLYMVGQTFGKSFVINTCNLSEDWVGYSTWHGDSAGDFSPLAKFTSDEVVAIGDACGLPYDLTHKVPSDGLCGQTDEDKLGFTYTVLNKYIRTGIIDDATVKAKIDKMHEKNKFKLQPLDCFKYDGENYAEDKGE